IPAGTKRGPSPHEAGISHVHVTEHQDQCPEHDLLMDHRQLRWWTRVTAMLNRERVSLTRTAPASASRGSTILCRGRGMERDEVDPGSVAGITFSADPAVGTELVVAVRPIDESHGIEGSRKDVAARVRGGGPS